MRVIRYIRDVNLAFALSLGRVLSYPVWIPLLLLGSFLGLALRLEDLVMVLLTIQTSVDSAATKMLQNHVREKDEQKDALIVQMLQAEEKRDRRTARQMDMLVTAVRAQNDLLDLIVKGGVLSVPRPRPARKADRRRNGTQP